MGKFIIVNPDNVIPSQNFVKESTVKFILESIVSGNLGKLPPPPIVRKTKSAKKYIAIDGHNLLVVKGLLGENIEVYVAESSSDFLIGHKTEKRNGELSENFDAVLDKVRKTKLNGINTILELRRKYFFLKDLETAKKYFGI